MITSLSQLDLDKKYTYADYLTWRLKERVELIMGKILEMSPAPSTRHQQILSLLASSLFHAKLPESCQIFLAPFDVRLYAPDENGVQTESVVQPDICLVCDQSKLDNKGCHGPPELMLEIISPSSERRDLQIKYKLYEKAGVPEYWVVNTVMKYIRVFTRNEQGIFEKSKEYNNQGLVKSATVPGFQVDLDALFPPGLFEEPEREYENS